MSTYGTGLYGTGVYGLSPAPPPPPGPVHKVSTVAWADSDIVFGGVDSFGVKWSWQSGQSAFGPSPAPRELSGTRAVAHGDWNATEFYGPRTWEVELLAMAPTHEALHYAESRLAATCSLFPRVAVADEPHFGQRWATFRRSGELLWTELQPLIARVSLSLRADDPLIRGTQQQAATAAPSTVGGLEWPTQWPASWDAVVSSGQLNLSNEGTMPASALWRLDGPIAEPYLIDIDTGRTLRTSLTLGDGEFLTIDTATRRVLAGGDIGASRRDRVYGDWFDIPPGGSRVQFGGSAPGAGAQLTATWASTWI